jgi:murein DD-endopeptidase MepM/ murein hydrolase activator NlpD
VTIRSRVAKRGLLLFTAVAVLAVGGCASRGRVSGADLIPHGWPVPEDLAAVTSLFGVARGGSRHEGLDLSAPKGTRVRATADGVVSFAGRSGDFGRLVVIDHGDGYQTRYAHLKSIEVKTGKRVQRGAAIGTVGKSGNATGYHLHYEVRLHGSAVNPAPYL